MIYHTQISFFFYLSDIFRAFYDFFFYIDRSCFVNMVSNNTDFELKLNQNSNNLINSINDGRDDLMQSNNKNQIIEIAKACLTTKWRAKKRYNTNKLSFPGPFCLDVIIRSTTCNECICPSEYCSNGGNGGIMGKLMKKYSDIALKNFENEDYQLIREILMELSKKGGISKILKHKIKNFR